MSHILSLLQLQQKGVGNTIYFIFLVLENQLRVILEIICKIQAVVSFVELKADKVYGTQNGLTWQQKQTTPNPSKSSLSNQSVRPYTQVACGVTAAASRAAGTCGDVLSPRDVLEHPPKACGGWCKTPAWTRPSCRRRCQHRGCHPPGSRAGVLLAER